MNYWLLHEDMSGTNYTRPTTLAHGSWFSIPHHYWTEGHDQTLSLPEKAMLLIALDQPDDSRLPYDQMPAWYGISPSTADRGIQALLDREWLTMTSRWQAEPKSASGWTEIRRYTAVGRWSIAQRKETMKKTKRPRRTPVELSTTTDDTT